jgi:hypothetical protein
MREMNLLRMLGFHSDHSRLKTLISIVIRMAWIPPRNRTHRWETWGKGHIVNSERIWTDESDQHFAQILLFWIFVQKNAFNSSPTIFRKISLMRWFGDKFEVHLSSSSSSASFFATAGLLPNSVVLASHRLTVAGRPHKFHLSFMITARLAQFVLQPV